jgi:hypothetical protein
MRRLQASQMRNENMRRSPENQMMQPEPQLWPLALPTELEWCLEEIETLIMREPHHMVRLSLAKETARRLRVATAWLSSHPNL